MRRVWGADYDGYLDYVTGWHAQAMTLLTERVGEFAFVTTNSITQGQPVPALFGPLAREGLADQVRPPHVRLGLRSPWKSSCSLRHCRFHLRPRN